MPFLGGFACKRLCQIHLRCDLSFFFLLRSFSGVSFYRGGNGYHFQGSRGGNDTRLHCLGTVEYLGLLFIALSLSTSIIFSFFMDCFSVHRIWGLVNNASLPLVCGWWDLVASETVGCGVVSV